MGPTKRVLVQIFEETVMLLPRAQVRGYLAKPIHKAQTVLVTPKGSICNYKNKFSVTNRISAPTFRYWTVCHTLVSCYAASHYPSNTSNFQTYRTEITEYAFQPSLYRFCVFGRNPSGHLAYESTLWLEGRMWNQLWEWDISHRIFQRFDLSCLHLGQTCEVWSRFVCSTTRNRARTRSSSDAAGFTGSLWICERPALHPAVVYFHPKRVECQNL